MAGRLVREQLLPVLEQDPVAVVREGSAGVDQVDGVHRLGWQGRQCDARQVGGVGVLVAATAGEAAALVQCPGEDREGQDGDQTDPQPAPGGPAQRPMACARRLTSSAPTHRRSHASSRGRTFEVPSVGIVTNCNGTSERTGVDSPEG